MAIRKVREHKPGRDNLSWGKYVQAAVTRRALGDSREITEGEVDRPPRTMPNKCGFALI
jgi:hypothetical protein